MTSILSPRNLALLTIPVATTSPDSHADDFCVFVVDDSVHAYAVHFRPWLEGRWRALAAGRPNESPQTIFRRLRRTASNVPMLLILRGTSVPTWVEEDMLGQDGVWLITERDGIFEWEAVELDQRDVPHRYRATSRSALLRILVDRDITRADTSLPLVLPVRAADASRGDRTIFVAGTHAKRDFPPDVWLEFDPPTHAPQQIRVDVTCRLGRPDVWDVQVETSHTSIPAYPCEAPAAVDHERQIRSLGLVVDRTAPDEQGWDAARQTANGIQQFWGQPTSGDGAPAPNQAIVDGLGPAIEAAFGHDVLIDLIAVGDQTDGDLSAPPGIPLAEDVVPVANDLAPGDIRAHASALAWAPGLDVWDPMEKGLDLALRAAERDSGHSAILIIGNSPPTPSHRSDDPFRSLLSGKRGFPATTVRRPSTAWQDLLERANELGIPVVYLFLSYRQLPGFPAQWFEPFQLLQEAVRDGLRGHRMRLVDTPATIEGIQRAMVVAAEVTRTPPARPHALSIAMEAR